MKFKLPILKLLIFMVYIIHIGCSSISKNENKVTEQEISESQKIVNISFESQTYKLCKPDIGLVTWNGYHNIQEVAKDGYELYSEELKIGEPIHGFEASGHSESFYDLLNAEPGKTRYFVCSLHPSAAKFVIMCPYNTPSL